MVNNDDFIGKPLRDLAEYLIQNSMKLHLMSYNVLYLGRYTVLASLLYVEDCMSREIVHISNVKKFNRYDIQIR